MRYDYEDESEEIIDIVEEVSKNELGVSFALFNKEAREKLVVKINNLLNGIVEQEINNALDEPRTRGYV